MLPDVRRWQVRSNPRPEARGFQSIQSAISRVCWRIAASLFLCAQLQTAGFSSHAQLRRQQLLSLLYEL